MGMFRLGPTELIIVLVIVLIIFGPRRLPEASHAIAKSIRDFRRQLSGRDDAAAAAGGKAKEA